MFTSGWMFFSGVVPGHETGVQHWLIIEITQIDKLSFEFFFTGGISKNFNQLRNAIKFMLIAAGRICLDSAKLLKGNAGKKLREIALLHSLNQQRSLSN